MAHNNSSFSYKTIHKNIKNVLVNRSKLNNTVQVAMPFVKATATIRLPEFLGEGYVGFTLGMHAIDQDVKAEDIYANQNGDALIGYTYNDETGTTKKVYAFMEEQTSNAREFFNVGDSLYGNSKATVIPPPGITSAKITKNRNGYVGVAKIQFSVPTLDQLEVLHRVFLVPGIGMVLEWGQQFAQDNATVDVGEGGLTGTKNMFPWYDKKERDALFDKLSLDKYSTEEITQEYVYPTQGQYNWMFGRVANFSTAGNADGSYDCTVTIFGPGENSWAYDIRRTVIPPKDACPESSNSIESYLNTTSNGYNLRSLLDATMGGNNPALMPWKDHVLVFKNGNNKDGSPKGRPPITTKNWADDRNGLQLEVAAAELARQSAYSSKPNVSEEAFGDSDDAYFMTWRFFVNVVLNGLSFGTVGGIKGIFEKAFLTPEELDKIALLRPYANGCSTDVAKETYLNDPYEIFVGANKYLRSIDPSTMIIVNEDAFGEANAYPGLKRDTDATRGAGEVITNITPEEQAFLNRGDFYKSAKAITEGAGAQGRQDRGFLSSGVWLNHKAVVQCLLSADTLLAGVGLLLQRMNGATGGYWNLGVDDSQTIPEDLCEDRKKQSYTVIDSNYRENAQYAVKNFLDNEATRVHIFNKYIRKDKNNTLYGSELTDCVINLDLPRRIFTQIATMGLVQADDLDPTAVDSPIISEPFDALRKMFAITSVSQKDSSGRSPDLTQKRTTERQIPDRTTCSKTNGQTTAGTAGVGGGLASNTTTYRPMADIAEAEKAATDTLNSELCKTPACKLAADEAASTPPVEPESQQEGAEVCYETDGGTQYCKKVVMNDKGKSANAQALYNAGYRNGQTSRNAFTPIGQDGHVMYKDAAEAFIRMRAAAAKVSITIRVTDSLRPKFGGKLSQFAQFKEKGQFDGPKAKGYKGRSESPYSELKGWAAVPGTSNHGWGLAVDIDTGEQGTESKVYQWMKENAGDYGFRTISNEPWHWEYTEIFPLTNPITPAPIVTPPPPPRDAVGPAPSPPITDLVKYLQSLPCEKCVIAAKALVQLQEQRKLTTIIDTGNDRLQREFPNLMQTLRYIELYPEFMIKNITRDSDGNSSNAWGSSPGPLSISVDMTLPGIGGIRMGELFWVDRMPAFYRVFGAFQVLSVDDTISTSNGWQTSIHGRFIYLGKAWKEKMATLLGAYLPADNGE